MLSCTDLLILYVWFFFFLRMCLWAREKKLKTQKLLFSFSFSPDILKNVSPLLWWYQAFKNILYLWGFKTKHRSLLRWEGSKSYVMATYRYPAFVCYSKRLYELDLDAGLMRRTVISSQICWWINAQTILVTLLVTCYSYFSSEFYVVLIFSIVDLLLSQK